jgi:hypothetical protein
MQHHTLSLVTTLYNSLRRALMYTIILLAFLCSAQLAAAASLSVSPSTGVYQTGAVFTATVMVNSAGQSINAADATLSFNPSELSVVSVDRSSSIFSLWVTEPTFSNSAGTISFSGGLPSGYAGSNGTVVRVTFRVLGSGSSRVTFSNGSVLANDGRGTNVLTSMNGGSYTIQAKSESPEPEVIVEYVPPANTPAAPKITSASHEDPSVWHRSATAELSWTLPGDITAVRTLLDDRPSTIPTKVYDTPIDSITLDELPEGVSYFHIQFRNADGWGKVSHYRLAVDSEKPKTLNIRLSEDANLANPEQTLVVTAEDETSEVRRFKIKVDDGEPFEVRDETGSGTIQLPPQAPGYHVVTVEAFDEAGNSIIDTFSFTVESFDRPVFTEYPSEINEEVIPVIKGQTRANATVEVALTKLGSEPTTYSVTSDAQGEFIFIPEGTFRTGTYELIAVATDEYGAVSDPSAPIRIAVQQPGIIQLGAYAVSILSVVVPLFFMVLVLIVGSWYLILRIVRLRRRVRRESLEALDIVRLEFSELYAELDSLATELAASRKSNKLTKSEAEVFAGLENTLKESEARVQKEVQDVAELVKNQKSK